MKKFLDFENIGGYRLINGSIPVEISRNDDGEFSAEYHLPQRIQSISCIGKTEEIATERLKVMFVRRYHELASRPNNSLSYEETATKFNLGSFLSRVKED